jgi:glycosyltransferase involved in cell wall biosynthesis
LKKPSILFVADNPCWAYHHIALFVKKELQYKYEIYIDFVSLNLNNEYKIVSINFYKQHIKNYIHKLKYAHTRLNKNYDIIVYLGGYMEQRYKSKSKSKYIIKGIYTEGFPPKTFDVDNHISFERFVNSQFANASALVVGTEKLKTFYEKSGIPCFYANGQQASNFVDLPIPPKEYNDKFIIGWTGDPSRKHKGLQDFIIPAVEQAQKLRPNIEFKTRFKGSYETLHQFYDEINLIMIASVADAGPSLFTEAAFRGVPAISNNSGRPSEVIVNMHNGILVERNIDEYVSMILKLYDNRILLKKLSENIRTDILAYYNQLDMRSKWDNLFQYVLNN